MNSKGVPGDDENDNREQLSSLRVQFVLPKGAYATTVLANAFEVNDGSRETPLAFGPGGGVGTGDDDSEGNTKTEEQ